MFGFAVILANTSFAGSYSKFALTDSSTILGVSRSDEFNSVIVETDSGVFRCKTTNSDAAVFLDECRIFSPKSMSAAIDESISNGLNQIWLKEIETRGCTFSTSNEKLQELQTQVISEFQKQFPHMYLPTNYLADLLEQKLIDEQNSGAYLENKAAGTATFIGGCQ